MEVKTKVVLRDAIIIAAEMHGSDGLGKDGLIGYLGWLSRDHPSVFAKLLQRVIPLQVTLNAEKPVQQYRSIEEIRQAFIDRGLPVPKQLLLEDHATTNTPFTQRH